MNVKPRNLLKNSKLRLQHKAPATDSNVSDVLISPKYICYDAKNPPPIFSEKKRRNLKPFFQCLMIITQPKNERIRVRPAVVLVWLKSEAGAGLSREMLLRLAARSTEWESRNRRKKERTKWRCWEPDVLLTQSEDQQIAREHGQLAWQTAGPSTKVSQRVPGHEWTRRLCSSE